MKKTWANMGELIRKNRIKARPDRRTGYTQQEVAEMLGLSNGQNISNWERGKANAPTKLGPNKAWP